MTTVTEPLSGTSRGEMRSPGLRALVTRAVVDKVLDAVPIRAIYPDGTVRGGGGPGSPELHITRPHRLFDRMSRNPKVGLGEGYMAGDWSVAAESDLAELLTPFAERVGSLVPRPLGWLRRLIDQPLPRGQRNTLEGSRANIHAHYDLSNELFASFLDPSQRDLFPGRIPGVGDEENPVAHRQKGLGGHLLRQCGFDDRDPDGCALRVFLPARESNLDGLGRGGHAALPDLSLVLHRILEPEVDVDGLGDPFRAAREGLDEELGGVDDHVPGPNQLLHPVGHFLGEEGVSSLPRRPQRLLAPGKMERLVVDRQVAGTRLGLCQRLPEVLA